MTRPTPRRPSRTTTPRPRRIGGADRSDHAAGGQDDSGVADDSRRARGPLVAGVLIVLVGVLALVLVGQVAWFVADAVRDDETTAIDESGSGDRGEGDPIPVPDGRPVVLDQLAVQEGVDAAAEAATSMFARDWEVYDQGVAEATKLMTSAFADEYRQTTDDVKHEFVAKRTKVQVQVVAQGVVRANESELEALVFLNQYIFRGRGKDATTAITPYRAVLTMVHTDQGWLVDDVQTK
jgi:Mce-associated membrane protein